MNLTDAEVLDLNTLCFGVADASISDAERVRLAAWLRKSPEARRHYVLVLSQSASLHHYAAEMQAEAPQAPARLVPWRRRWAMPAAVLGVLMVLALAIHPWSRVNRPETEPRVVEVQSEQDDDPEVADAGEPVARLSGLKDCAWSGADYSSGDEISPDSHLDLLKGLAEITFDSGARITLEGPATVVIHSAWETELFKGSLKAQVPKEAIGFRVLNRAVNVVDLGTEFSISAEEGGEAEVLVLKGSVEAQPRATPNERVLLSETQGRRFSKSGVSEMRQREQKLAKWSRKFQLDRIVKPVSVIQWPIDSPMSAATQQSTALPVSLSWHPIAASASSSAASENQHAHAIDLDSTAYSSAKVPVSGGAKGTRTVAFWVKVPSDASPSVARPMVAFQPRDGDMRTEIGWNISPDQGAFGALRITTPHGYVVASTPLRDGNWHYVAALFGKVHHPTDKLHVRLYVDGRLEHISSARRAMKRANHDGLLKTGTLWIGRSPTTPVHANGFRGSVDQLILADRILTPGEVRTLMRENRMAPLVDEGL